MKKLFYFLSFSLILSSCSDNEEDVNMIESDIAAEVAAGFSTLRMTFDQPVIYSFENEAQRDEIISIIIDELYEVDLVEGFDKEGNAFREEVAVNLTINEGNHTITVLPEPILQVTGPVSTTDGDDEDCGGKAGDGWKSYGTCMSKPCVKEKSTKAALELSKKLENGKCLDIRVKHNTFNARVCGRVVGC